MSDWSNQSTLSIQKDTCIPLTLKLKFAVITVELCEKQIKFVLMKEGGYECSI